MCITKKENVFVQSINIMTESLNQIPGRMARWILKILTCMDSSHFPLSTWLNCISVSFVLYFLRNQPIWWLKRIMNSIGIPRVEWIHSTRNKFIPPLAWIHSTMEWIHGTVAWIHATYFLEFRVSDISQNSHLWWQSMI